MTGEFQFSSCCLASSRNRIERIKDMGQTLLVRLVACDLQSAFDGQSVREVELTDLESISSQKATYSER